MNPLIQLKQTTSVLRFCAGSYWRQGVRKGTSFKNLTVSKKAMLLICLVLLTGCNHDPTANAGGPYSGMAGISLTFDGSVSSDPDNDPLTFTWDCGDGTSATGTAPTHTYSTAGTFTIKLTADDGHGGKNVASTTATIVPKPPPSATRTTFLKSDWKSWTSVGGASLSVASDSGTNTAQWKFRQLAGADSDIGVIESVQFPGKCLRSPDDNADSQIEFAVCDTNDQRQRWKALLQQMSGGKGFYSFLSRADEQWCLTEGSNSRVIQSHYNITDNQLWAVRHNDTFAFDTDLNPWSQ